jgi:hypothetical protein
VAPYLGPTGTVVAGAALLVGAPAPVVQALLVIAAGILLAVSIKLAWHQPTLFLVVLAGAAVCWAVGNGVWLIVGDILAAVPWWLSFLILTFAGARLELTRLLPESRWGPRQFVIIAVVILVSATGALWWPDGSLGYSYLSCNFWRSSLVEPRPERLLVLQHFLETRIHQVVDK